MRKLKPARKLRSQNSEPNTIVITDTVSAASSLLHLRIAGRHFMTHWTLPFVGPGAPKYIFFICTAKKRGACFHVRGGNRTEHDMGPARTHLSATEASLRSSITLKNTKKTSKQVKQMFCICLFYGAQKLRESPWRRLDFDVGLHAVEVFNGAVKLE